MRIENKHRNALQFNITTEEIYQNVSYIRIGKEKKTTNKPSEINTTEGRGGGAYPLWLADIKVADGQLACEAVNRQILGKQTTFHGVGT